MLQVDDYCYGDHILSFVLIERAVNQDEYMRDEVKIRLETTYAATPLRVRDCDPKYSA